MRGVSADLPRRCERYLKPLTCRMQDAVYVSQLLDGDGGQVYAASVTQYCVFIPVFRSWLVLSDNVDRHDSGGRI